MERLNALKTFLLLVIIFVSCGQTNKNSSVVIGKIVSDSVKTIDLDKCEIAIVNFDKIYTTHNNFDKVGEIDTLKISDELISVKKAKNRVQNTNECLNSELTVYYRKRKVFIKDSIATSGMYDYNAEKGLLAIPVITFQDRDNFHTLTTIYLCNLKNGIVRTISKDLINSSFALFYHHGEKMIYSNSDKLFVYDIQSCKEHALLNFDNPRMAVFRLEIKNGSLEIFYFKDFTDDLLNNYSMRKAKFKLTEKF